ncbi:MAG: hypothetical protein R3Y11_12900, partial [Pseudomonadota bacterium]
ITGLFSWLCAYPALYAIVGTTLPSLAGRFLEGASGTVRSYKAAGLPNIEGEFMFEAGTKGTWLGAMSSNTGTLQTITSINSSVTTHTRNAQAFDASKSNSIYGNSTTVQPKSYTVNYLIKAY